MPNSLFSNSDVTLVTVNFGNSEPLRLNIELAAKLNPGPSSPHWVVVDNSRDGGCEGLRSDSVMVIDGAPSFRKAKIDAGSYHHAAGLKLGLDQVRTRFALVIDPDFYVIQDRWIERVLAHVSEHRLVFFGSCWHPKWTIHPRYFPTVHFFLVDLEKVRREEIDFTPGFCEDPFWLFYIRHCRKLKPGGAAQKLFWRLQTARFRDTGWGIRRRFLSDPKTPSEVLAPSFQPPPPPTSPILRAIEKVLPDRLSFVPKREKYFTTRSFLKIPLPEAHEAGWEEFFWSDVPFAAHLRRVGRRHGKTQSKEEQAQYDLELLHRFLKIDHRSFK